MAIKKGTKVVPQSITAKNKIAPFIAKYYAKYGYTPTLKEIGDHFKVSKQQAYNYTRLLVHEDYIRIRPAKTRGIVLIGSWYQQLTQKDKK